MSYSITDVMFWAYAAWFGVAFIISCVIPGMVVARRFKLSPLQHLLIASVAGIVMWGIQGYIFGYLGLRWLSYLYLLSMLVLTWRERVSARQQLSLAIKTIQQTCRTHLIAIGLAVFGGIIQLAQVITTGLRYQNGIDFFRVNAYDGMLHLSFIASIVRQFPPQEPGATGLPITNYHYWSDLVMAELCRVWGLPITHSFFQYWPIVLTIFTSFAAYTIVKKWTGSYVAACCSLFFLLFGADTAYLVMLILHHQFGFTISAIDNGATQFLNIPHSFAKMIFLTGLLPLTEWINTKDKRWAYLTLLFLAPVVGFKIYFGIFSAMGFSLVVGWMIIGTFITTLKQKSFGAAISATIKREWLSVACVAIFAAISLAIFLPPNQHAGNLFWSPLEWPKLFLSRDQLDFRDWWLRKQVYDAAGNIRGIVVLDTIAIVICLLAVYGTRLLGVIAPLTSRRRLPFALWLFFVPGIVLFTSLGLYTLQTSGLFNVFNFFAVASVGLALLSSLVAGEWLSARSWWLKAVIAVIIVLSLPRITYHAWQAVDDQVRFHYEQVYSPAELSALQYVQTETPVGSIIQSHPHNYLDMNTPYVSYFSNRPTFLTGVGMLRSHNQPIDDRLVQLNTLFASHSSLEFSNLLKQDHIDYVYLQKKTDQTLPFEIESSNLKVVYENEAATILQPI